MVDTAFVLSGGGAKGSFEVGALRFLYGLQLHPNLIVGTSVGSINGAKLAEGENRNSPADDPQRYPSGFTGLFELWRGLQREEDMYVQSQYFTELQHHIDEAKHAGLWGGIAAVFTGAPGAVFLLTAKDQIDAALYQATVGPAGSLYSLEPIERRFREPGAQINPGWVDSSRIDLYMAVVGMTTGRLRYVRANGEVYDHADLESAMPYVSVSLSDGVMASAAIPAIFEPKRFLNEFQVDGGVRELLPMSVALEKNARRIFAVVASPPFRADADPEQRAPFSLPEVVLRAIDLVTDEVGLKDTARAKRPQTYLIQPWYTIHETTVVDRGLIRINIDYGWMKAFDVTTSSVRTRPRRQFLTYLGDEIATARKKAWTIETRLLGSYPWGVEPDDIEELRQTKCYIKSLVGRRTYVGDVWSLPPEIDPGEGGPERWWSQLEEHSDKALADIGWQEHATYGDAPQIDPDESWSDGLVEFLKGHRAPDGYPARPASRVYPTEEQLRRHLLGLFADCPEPTPHREDQRFYTDTVGSGFFQPSTIGEDGDFQLLAAQGPLIVHYRRANDEPGVPWHYSGIAYDAEARQLPPGLHLTSRRTALIAPDFGDWSPDDQRERWPVGVSFFQGNFGIPGNLEAVIRVRSRGDEPNAERGDRLVFAWWDAHNKNWKTPAEIQVHFPAVGLRPISGVTGNPAFIPSRLSSGDFQLLVPQGPRLNHYRRVNSSRDLHWEFVGTVYDANQVAVNPRFQVDRYFDQGEWPSEDERSRWPLGCAVFQSGYGDPGNLELVVRLKAGADDANADRGDLLYSSWYDSQHRRWQQPEPMYAYYRSPFAATAGLDLLPVTGVTGDPSTFPSTLGGAGDFQMLVPQGPLVVHYHRLNDTPPPEVPPSEGYWPFWKVAGIAYDAYGQPASRLAAEIHANDELGDLGDWQESSDHERWPTAVSAFEGGYGEWGDERWNWSGPRNLEAIIQVHPRQQDQNPDRGDALFFTWYDIDAKHWTPPEPIIATFPSAADLRAHPITGVTLG